MRKRKKPIVFIDMDGVVVNTQYEMAKLFGIPEMSKPAKYDLWKDHGIVAKEFWAKMRTLCPEKWANMSYIVNGLRMVRGLMVSGIDIVFLSNATLLPNSATGKLLWIERLFPDPSFRPSLVMTDRKELLAQANPGTILVDDWGKNINIWRRHGGVGLLVATSYSAEYPLIRPYTNGEIVRFIIRYYGR